MDILTIGEVLIDLTQTGKDARGIPQFAANPGGCLSLIHICKYPSCSAETGGVRTSDPAMRKPVQDSSPLR